MDRKILLVEDDEEFRSMLEITLTDAGYSVVAAGDCSTAEQLWTDAVPPFDLLVTDVRLSEEDDGFVLAEKLLALKPNTPVMFVSGDPDCFASPAIQRFADSPFLAKPFELKRFVAVVGKLLARTNPS